MLRYLNSLDSSACQNGSLVPEYLNIFSISYPVVVHLSVDRQSLQFLFGLYRLLGCGLVKSATFISH